MIYFEDVGSTGQMKSIRNQQALKLADANNSHGEKVFALCSSKLWNTLLLDVQKSNTQTQRPNSRPSLLRDAHHFVFKF